MEMLRRILADEVPGPNLKFADRALPGAQALYWRDHPLFYLLDDLSAHDRRTLATFYAFDSLPGSVRLSLWEPSRTGDEPWTGCYPMYPDERRLRDVLEGGWLDQLSPLDQLVGYVAVSLEATALRLADVAFKAALRSQELFVLAVRSSPHIRAGWQSLAELMFELVWSPASALIGQAIPIGRIEESLSYALAKDVSLQAEYPWITQTLMDDQVA